MILAGEIGATRTRLAAFETEGNRLKCVVEKIYASHDYNGLAEILPQFTRSEGIPVHSACFGVAGPVRAGRSKISNLPWTIDCKELAAQLKLPAACSTISRHTLTASTPSSRKISSPSARVPTMRKAIAP